MFSDDLSHLTHSHFKVVLQKSIPAQICQLILYVCNSTGKVDRSVGKLTSTKRFTSTLCEMMSAAAAEVFRRSSTSIMTRRALFRIFSVIIIVFGPAILNSDEDNHVICLSKKVVSDVFDIDSGSFMHIFVAGPDRKVLFGDDPSAVAADVLRKVFDVVSLILFY